jgi:hypothetical protein
VAGRSGHRLRDRLGRMAQYIRLGCHIHRSRNTRLHTAETYEETEITKESSQVTLSDILSAQKLMPNHAVMIITIVATLYLYNVPI